jgi:hypothetical protein
MKKITYALILLTITTFQLKSQKQLEHPKKMHKDAEGKLFINKNQPMYLFLGTDPNNRSEAKKLESEASEKYANPFYFDSEGLNTVRTPSQVDPVTKQLVYPIADIVFEVYADGIAPKTNSQFLNTKTYTKENVRYFGPSLKVTLRSSDKTSGIENIYYSINGSPYQIYTDSLSFNEEQEYTVKYYAVDFVGNVEEVNVQKFTIDKTPPSHNWKFGGETSGKTVSGRSLIELMATDAKSGVKNIKYQIDDKPVRLYSAPIALSQINTGEHDFKYWIEDNVGNIAGEDNGTDKEVKVYAFIVDDVNPTTSANVEGDQYAGSKYLYVSTRSKCKLDGEDDQLGINKITYSFNNKKLDNVYESPIAFETANGPQAVFFQSYDMVANKSNIETLVVYMDNEEPITGIDFKGPQFFNRDTMFINSKTELLLKAEDNASGIKETSYSIDNGESNIGTTFSIKDDGFHTISFETTDNVNNKETTKESEVVVDNVGPEIYVNFSIKPIRKVVENGKEINVYPPFVKMYIGATDYKCGTNSIWYSIDGSTKTKYSSSGSPADMEKFKTEKVYSVVIDATDNLGNKMSKEIQFKVAKK